MLSSSLRSPDHRHVVRGEDRPDRVRRRRGLPFLEVHGRLLGGCGRDLDRDGSRLRVDRDGESALSEHLDHPVVLGEHLRLEDRDPRVEGSHDQVPDQQRAQSRPLELIRDAHAQLGSCGVLADVLSPSDDRASIPSGEGQEREVVRSVTVHRLRRDIRHVDRRRPEPEAPGLVRQPDQVVLDQGLILCPRRSKVNGSAVTEDDLPLELLRRRYVHVRATVVLPRTPVRRARERGPTGV